MFQESSRVFHISFKGCKGILKNFNGNFRKVSNILERYFKKVSRVFLESL